MIFINAKISKTAKYTSQNDSHRRTLQNKYHINTQKFTVIAPF